MISAPIAGPCRSAIALSRPSVPPGSPRTSRWANRVANIHSWSRRPACPNGVSRDCPSPVANPSSEIEKLWTRTRDIPSGLPGLGGEQQRSERLERGHELVDLPRLEAFVRLRREVV